MNNVKLTPYSLAIMLGAVTLNAMQPATVYHPVLTETELACQAGTMEQHFQEIAHFITLNPAWPMTTRQGTPTADVVRKAPADKIIKPHLSIQKLQSGSKADTTKSGQFGIFQWKSPARKIASKAVALPKQEQTYTPEAKAIPISRTTSSELGARDLTQLAHKSPTASIPASSSSESSNFSSPVQPLPYMALAAVEASCKRARTKVEETEKWSRRMEDLNELEVRVAAAAAREAAKK